MSIPNEVLDEEIIDPEINIPVRMTDLNRAVSKRYMIEDLQESAIDLRWNREQELDFAREEE